MECFDARDTGSRGVFSLVRSANADMESEAFSAGYLEKYYLK